MFESRSLATLLLLLAPLHASARQVCTSDWVRAFGATPGADERVLASVVYDDGAGPALYIGGWFKQVDGVLTAGIARWDGAAWSYVGGGMGGLAPRVYALTVFDDGSGPALYAGGSFNDAGGVAGTALLARWDGVTWSGVGSSSVNHIVRAFAVFDDGSGAALYVGGEFTTAGGATANRIARWDGTSWSPVGGGFPSSVEALRVHDDGTGRALYAGGNFQSGGGVGASRIARWDGSVWSPLGSGINGSVLSLASFNDGTGPALFAGGQFTSAGGVPAANLARWNGSTWQALDSVGMNARVSALTVFNDGSGAALHAGGDFTSAGGIPGTQHIARWNGTAWSALGGADDKVSTLTVFDDGSGPALHVGGFFNSAGGVAASKLARWNGAAWSKVSTGTGLNGWVYALAEFDDGSGPAVYAGGVFTVAGSAATHGIARWDGTSWSSLSSGVNAPVIALAVHDDGSGPALYCGGEFTIAGGVAVNRLARWDGTAWSDVGGGTNQPVYALGVVDIGSGPALYVGGIFTSAGGAPAGAIARWDGNTLSAVGAGIWQSGAFVADIVEYDDGSGPGLYVGGNFTSAGGAASVGLARWDGSSWSDVGGSMDSGVRALAIFDDGAGPALYVGGTFTIAGAYPVGGLPTGGISASSIARWDGVAWSAVGGGVSSAPIDPVVYALTVLDDGSGSALYASGRFSGAGGVAANNVARWNGAAWSALGAGLPGEVRASTSFDDGSGPAFAAGGLFLTSPAGESYIAKWGCELTLLATSYCFGDHSGTLCPCGNAGAADEGCANGTGQGAKLAAAGSSNVGAANLVLSGANLVPAQAGLYFQGNQRLNAGNGLLFGDGLRCAGGGLVRLQVVAASAAGVSSTTLDLVTKGGVAAGDVRTYQLWYRDPLTTPCGTGFNLTHGLELAWLP